jgi:Domain of unknown function (DUF4357)
MTDRPTTRRGRTLKLYLVDGTPSGVITAELGVSSVRAVVASRTALPELIKREEALRTGVYLLVGPDPELSGRTLVYVGEGDQVKTRLQAHDADEAKDFFTRAVLIVSKDENLTKAHGRYLESRVIAAIRIAGRAKLVNGTEPPFRGLPEPEIADMERVLDEIEVLLPVLGFDMLRPAVGEQPQTTGSGVPQATAEFVFREATTSARARETNDEFVVLTGSLARTRTTESCSDSVKRRRQDLMESGALKPTADGKHLEFITDVPFDTPSGAGAVVYGGSVNGRLYWKHAVTGQSYNDWRGKLIEISGGAA